MIGAATGGIFHGLGKAAKGLGSKFSKAFPGISDELRNCFRALSGKAKDDLIALGRYIDDIVNRLNPKGVAVDAYGGKYSLPNDKSTFEDFINYIVGHGDDSVGKVSEGGGNPNSIPDEFYKHNGGMDKADTISIHAEKHLSYLNSAS